MTLNPRAIPAKLQRLHHLYLYHIDRLVSRRIWEKNLECRKPRSCNAFRSRNMTRKGWGGRWAAAVAQPQAILYVSGRTRRSDGCR